MDLSLPILMDYLPNNFNAEYHQGRGVLKPKSKQVRFGARWIKDARDSIVVIDLKSEGILNLPAPHLSNSFIVLGYPEKLPKNIECVIIDDSVDYFELLDVLSEVSSRVAEWRKKLDDALLGKESLNVLVRLGYEMLENEFCLQSAGSFVIGFTPHVQDYLHPFVYDSQARLLSNDRDVLKWLNTHPEFHTLLEADGIAPSDLDGFDSITYNFKVEGQSIARIIMPLNRRPFTPGFRQLCEMYFARIEYALSRYALDSAFLDVHSMREELMELITNESTNRHRADQSLLEYGWDPRDRYLCVASKHTLRKKQSTFIDYFQIEASNRLSRGFLVALIVGDFIITVINLSLTSCTDDELYAFYDDNMLVSGMSRPTESIWGIRDAYQQACIALDLGQKLRDSQGDKRKHFPFDEFALPYMLDKTVSELSVRQVIPRGLIALKDYDHENAGSCLAETLEVFLANSSNATRAAEMLNIHRSSLLYRLERVYEIVGCDFQNPDDRLYYQWSFALLKRSRP